MKTSRRFLSALLALVMTLTLLPDGLPAADAAQDPGEWIEIDSALKLREELEKPGSAKLRLTKDIVYTIPTNDTGRDKDWNYPEKDLYWCTPKGTKVLDLCRFDIELKYGYNNSGTNVGRGKQLYLFKLEKLSTDASAPDLTITDSTVSPGEITFDGYVLAPDSVNNEVYFNYRNLFHVGTGCSLTVNGGRLICGRSKEQWITRGTCVDDYIGSVKEGNTFLDSMNVVYSNRYDGYARQNINGHAIYNDGGTVTVNAGEVEGRGHRKMHLEAKGDPDRYGCYMISRDIRRNAAIVNCAGRLIINDGIIRGSGDADALQIGNEDLSDVVIRGGEFSVSDIEKTIVPFDDDALPWEWHLDGYYLSRSSEGGGKGALAADIRGKSGKSSLAIADLIDKDKTELTVNKSDEAAVSPKMQTIESNSFTIPGGSASSASLVYDPGAASYYVGYCGSTEFSDVCPEGWFPIPAYSPRIQLDFIKNRWFLFDENGNPVGDEEGYAAGTNNYTLNLSAALSDEEKANLSGALIVVFRQEVTRYGATTMTAVREGRIRLSVGSIGVAEITQQPRAITLVPSFIDDGNYWHILDEAHYEATGEKDALPNGKDITLTASATGINLSCWWVVDRGDGRVILNSDQYVTTRDGDVVTSTLTVPVRSYTKPERFWCVFGNAAGFVYSDAAFVALKPSLKSRRGASANSNVDGHYNGYAGQSVAIQFRTTRPDCECVWTWTYTINKKKYSHTLESGDKYEVNGYTLIIHDLSSSDANGTYNCRPVYQYCDENGVICDNKGSWKVSLAVSDPPEENVFNSVAITGFGDLIMGKNAPTTDELSVVTDDGQSIPYIELVSIQWNSGVENGVVTSATPSYTIQLRALGNRCFQYDEDGEFVYTLDGVVRTAYGTPNCKVNTIALSYSYSQEEPVIVPPDTITFEKTSFVVYKNYDNRVQIPVTVTPNALFEGEERTLESLTLVTGEGCAALPDGLKLSVKSPGLLWGVVPADFPLGICSVYVRAVSSHGDEMQTLIDIVVEELPENLTAHVHKWEKDKYGEKVVYKTDDYTHSCTCSTCGHVEKHPHVWDNGVIVTRAEEGKYGTIKYTCTVCGYTRTAPYPYEYEPDWTVYLFAKLEGKKLTYSITASKSLSAVAVIMTYDEDGRPLECYAESVTPRLNVSTEFSKTLRLDAYTYRVFLVDARTYAPLCACWEYSKAMEKS